MSDRFLGGVGTSLRNWSKLPGKRRKACHAFCPRPLREPFSPSVGFLPLLLHTSVAFFAPLLPLSLSLSLSVARTLSLLLLRSDSSRCSPNLASASHQQALRAPRFIYNYIYAHATLAQPFRALRIITFMRTGWGGPPSYSQLVSPSPCKELIEEARRE